MVSEVYPPFQECSTNVAIVLAVHEFIKDSERF